MKEYCLITGASSGIGRALAIHMARKGYGIVAVATNRRKLKETQNLSNVSSDFHLVVADLTIPEDRDKVVREVNQLCHKQIRFLVHNAGVIGQVDRFENIDLTLFQQAMNLNVEAPLMLTQKLLPEFIVNHNTKEDPNKIETRILHISSGAAHKPVKGWLTYNVTKAAFHMLYQCLHQELEAKNIVVGSVAPGIVSTPMQTEIRTKNEDAMPHVQKFRDFKENEYKGPTDIAHKPPVSGLDCAENVAFFLHFLLTETESSEFGQKEWDIRHESHHHRWINK